MVLIRPKRSASRAATRYENAVRMPVQKKIALAVAIDRPKRWYSHSATSDCTTKPPPNASRLNRAARV